MGGECDTADDLRRMVRLHHKMGADFVKVMSTGGFMTTGSAPWYAQFTTAQLALIVAVRFVAVLFGLAAIVAVLRIGFGS